MHSGLALNKDLRTSMSKSVTKSRKALFNFVKFSHYALKKLKPAVRATYHHFLSDASLSQSQTLTYFVGFINVYIRCSFK